MIQNEPAVTGLQGAIINFDTIKENTMCFLKYLICIAASLIYSPFMSGQTVLFPGLEGEQLQQALHDNYRPSFTLSLSQAKDTIYTVIDNVQDSVEGIYSGYTLYLPDGVDASQWLFMNGTGINLEHAFPQSKGADEGMPGHSDMHHLYPSRVAVNEARASFPFEDIPDNLTSIWFRKDISMQSIPTTDIDAYSESINDAFEPRESVKGNIARSVFYFYTMYQEDANAADPDFFANQRQTLCQWHLDDPIDDAELARSDMIAHYQESKENPFILDCTAALRAWCPEYKGCTTSITSLSADNDPFLISSYALDGQIVLRFESEKSQNVTVSVYDLAGRKMSSLHIPVMEGTSEYSLQKLLIPGIYAISCIGSSRTSTVYTTRCVVR